MSPSEPNGNRPRSGIDASKVLVTFLLVLLGWQWSERALFATLAWGHALRIFVLALPFAALAALVAVWVRPAVPQWVVALVVAGVLLELALAVTEAVAGGRTGEIVLWLASAYVAFVAFAVALIHARVKWMTPSLLRACSVDEACAAAAADLRAPVAQVVALGFVPVSGIIADHGPAFPRAVLLEHRDDAACASVTAFSARPPLVVTEIGQRNASGRGLSVCDSTMPRFHPEFDCGRLLRFPRMPAAGLWTTFRSIRQATTDGGPWVRDEDEPFAAARASVARQVEEFRRRGYLAALEGPGGAPLTWRGAVRFTLAAVLPWKWWVDRAQVAQARRAAAEADAQRG